MCRPRVLSKEEGINTFYSMVRSTIDALCKNEKGVNPPRYGKKASKVSQVRFLRRKMINVEFPERLMGSVEFPGATECPSKYEARKK